MDNNEMDRTNAEINRIDSRVLSVDDLLPTQFFRPADCPPDEMSVDVFGKPEVAEFVLKGLNRIGIGPGDIAANPDLDAVANGLARLYFLQEQRGEQ